MSENPLVSVLVCTYNSEGYISNTLDSVLDQSYDNIEVLIRDDASEDATVDILNKYSEIDNRITVFESKENVGPYKGLNKLLESAQGEYIAIQDHDDIWHPSKVQAQIKFLETHSEYVGCGSPTITLWENKNKIYIDTRSKEHWFSPHPSLVFRNEGYRYDTTLSYKTDTYFMKEVLCNGDKKLYNLQNNYVMTLVKESGAQLSQNWIDARGVTYYALKAKQPQYILKLLKWWAMPHRYPSTKVNRIEQKDEWEPAEVLRDNKFLQQYLPYIHSYLSEPLNIDPA